MRIKIKRNMNMLCVIIILIGLFYSNSINVEAATKYNDTYKSKFTSIKTSVEKDGYCSCTNDKGKKIAKGSPGHYCCYKYASKAYKKYWGKDFVKKADNNMLKGVPANDRTLTAGNLKKLLCYAEPGAVVRIGNSSNFDSSEDTLNQHSLVFCGLNNNCDGAYFLIGNHDGKGSSTLKEIKFSTLAQYPNKNNPYKYIKWIIWPDASKTNLVFTNPKVTGITSEGACIECDIKPAKTVKSIVATVWSNELGINKYKEVNYAKKDGNRYYFNMKVSDFSNIRGDYSSNIHVNYTDGTKNMIISPIRFTIPSHTHNYNTFVKTITEATCTEDGSVQYKCDCGLTTTKTVSKLGHQWETVPYKAPGCITFGNVAYKKCTRCGTQTNAMPFIYPTGHTEVIDSAIPATCSQTGLTEGKHCSICNKIIKKQEVIPALGHNWDSGVITKQPTSTECGVKTYTCQTCGAKKVETIAAIEKEDIQEKIDIVDKIDDYSDKTTEDDTGYNTDIIDKSDDTNTDTQTTDSSSDVKTNPEVNPKSETKTETNANTDTTKNNSTDNSKLTNTSVNVPYVGIKSIKKSKKSLTVKWKSDIYADGYEIQYSTSKNFKSGKTKKVIVSDWDKESKKLKNLKKKKKYYVRIRAYRYVNGKYYYSAWSDKKSAKTK